MSETPEQYGMSMDEAIANLAKGVEKMYGVKIPYAIVSNHLGPHPDIPEGELESIVQEQIETTLREQEEWYKAKYTIPPEQAYRMIRDLLETEGRYELLDGLDGMWQFSQRYYEFLKPSKSIPPPVKE